jgi:FixJ family two-component response regulator
VETGWYAAEAPVISVVDDDLSMRNSTRRLIRSFGFRAEAFASPQEFLESGRVKDTACLVLDVRMPGMDGLELQYLLASKNHLVPIIFVTAHANDEEERQAREAGAADFLRKPVSEQALISAIQAAIQPMS